METKPNTAVWAGAASDPSERAVYADRLVVARK